jgi:hypothetical protein
MMNFLMNRFGGIGGFGGKRTVVVAVGLAAVAVAAAYKRRTAQKARQARLKQLQQDQDQASAFENRYLKEYDELADDPDAPVPPSHAHVRETTPQGDVIMTYDADREMFCYYCDKRSVQFKYLEPVARKYVVEHGCKRLYIDFRQATATQATATQATQATAKATAKAAGNSEEATKTVFAQLKKYGNPKPAQGVLKEQVTRYWYCGNMNEYNAHSAAGDAANTHDFSIIKPIDYASYKKMSSGS